MSDETMHKCRDDLELGITCIEEEDFAGKINLWLKITGTLRTNMIPIKFCPFCGYEAKK